MIQNKHNNRISVKDYCCLETVTDVTRELKIRRRRRQRERQKSNRFRFKQNNNFARASRFFVHFFAVVAWLRTWKCLISGFVEDGNRRQQLSNLRSRSLKVVGARKNGRERETRSRAPVLSCAHCFQAPVTHAQANNSLFLFLSFDTVL